MTWEIAALAFIALAGVPHGALDPLIARNEGMYKTASGQFLFAGAYLLVALLVIGVWLLAPKEMLVFFLIVSAFHFGRDQAFWMLGAPYGMFVLAIPAWFHPEQVAQIFSYILFGQDPTGIVTLLQMAGIAAAFFLVLGIDTWNQWFALELLALLVAAFIFPPIFYFALFFVLLHSWRHLSFEFRRLASSERPVIFKNLLSYTALTFLLAGLAYAFFENLETVEQAVYQILFIGLAGLTVPHMMLIEWVKAARS